MKICFFFVCNILILKNMNIFINIEIKITYLLKIMFEMYSDIL